MSNPDLDALDFHDWVEYGISNGWIAKPSCYHHDAIPCTYEEELEMEEGGDPCLSVIRVWDV